MSKIINYCPTGTQPTKENSLAPLYASEIVEDVHAAYEIGITVVHVHARIGNENSYKAEDYEPIVTGIRKYCPNLSICVSLTGRLFPELEKRTEVLQLYPDMGSLTLSSLNFMGGASVNAPETIMDILGRMNEYGVKPELECFDSGMVNYAKYLIKLRALQPPYYFNVILGNIFNAQSDPSTIAEILNSAPKEDAFVSLGGIGSQQLISNVMGLMYADGIRIGLEDNLYLENRELATNLSLLVRIRKIMKELGITTMAPQQFQSLGFKNSKNSK